jgi:uncharacterized protein with NRDE domain
MCVIYLAFRSHPRYRLVVAANRDEFHDRPTAPVARWEDESGVIAGRDLRSGGTWMGMHARGRFAALTNFREPLPQVPPAPTRGALVASYLAEGGAPERWLRELAPRAAVFAGFSIFASDLATLGHYSNRGGDVTPLGPGVYAVSNGLIGDPWPKVVRGREKFARSLEGKGDLVASLLELLADSSPATDGELPHTGVGIERERMLSPIFIRGVDYGTRSSSVLLVGEEGEGIFVERSFGPGGAEGETREERFEIER